MLSVKKDSFKMIPAADVVPGTMFVQADTGKLGMLMQSQGGRWPIVWFDENIVAFKTTEELDKIIIVPLDDKTEFVYKKP